VFLFIAAYRKEVNPNSPDQYLEPPPEIRNQQAFDLLRGRFAATLAMATGGCARYAFCLDVGYCFDRRGYTLLNYSSPNPHHHLILTNTTMTLRLPHNVDSEGNELSILIITGMLTLVDPGDHDSIDRHARYFQSITENYSRGESRLYRLVPDGACFELFSGKRLDVDLPAIVRRNLLSPREEEQLIAEKNTRIDTSTSTLVGMDAYGVDLRLGTELRFRPFGAAPVDRPGLSDAIRSAL
jgi:hypothetical protein